MGQLFRGAQWVAYASRSVSIVWILGIDADYRPIGEETAHFAKQTMDFDLIKPGA
jgi:hypothetical protein